MASHSINNPGPEPSYYDNTRHEKMVLRSNGMYGIQKFFVDGFKEDRWCQCGCDKLKVWCPKNENNKKSV